MKVLNLPSSLSMHTVLESAYRPGSASWHRPINEQSPFQVRLVLSGVISLQSLLPPVPCVGLSGSIYIHTQSMGSTTQARCQRAGIWDKVGRRGYGPSCLILYCRLPRSLTVRPVTATNSRDKTL